MRTVVKSFCSSARPLSGRQMSRASKSAVSLRILILLFSH